MISQKVLLDIIATEAIEGQSIPEDHPDEEAIIYHNMPERDMQSETKLPPIEYRLELIQRKDGSLHWVE